MAFTVFAGGSASAAVVTFSDRSTFLAGAGAVFSEGFEDASFNSGPSFDFGAFMIGSSAGTLSKTFLATLVSEGSSSISLSENATLTLTFDTAIRSIGFDINELNSGDMDYADNAGNSVADAVLRNFSGSTFFGLIGDTGFSMVTLSFGGQNSSVVGFDNVQFGSGPELIPVPLPVGMPLLLSGLAMLLLMRARRAAMSV